MYIYIYNCSEQDAGDTAGQVQGLQEQLAERSEQLDLAHSQLEGMKEMLRASGQGAAGTNHIVQKRMTFSMTQS